MKESNEEGEGLFGKKNKVWGSLDKFHFFSLFLFGKIKPWLNYYIFLEKYDVTF